MAGFFVPAGASAACTGCGTNAWPGATINVVHTKAADKVSYARAIGIRLDIALVPGQPKGRIGHLDQKEVIVGIGPQAKDFHMEILDGTEMRDGHPPFGAGQTSGG